MTTATTTITVSTAKHSPGPWTVDIAQGVFDANDVCVCYAHVSESYGRCADPIAIANARLMAAAPAMLEALQCALAVMLVDGISDKNKLAVDMMFDAMKSA